MKNHYIAILVAFLIFPYLLFAQDSIPQYNNKAKHSFFYRSVLGGGMTIINESGPDIFKPNHSYDFEVGYSISKFYNNRKSQLEYGWYFARYNTFRTMKIDLVKMMELQYEDYSYTFLYNRRPLYWDFDYGFTFDYWHHFNTKNGNSLSFKLGFTIMAPEGSFGKNIFGTYPVSIADSTGVYNLSPIVKVDYTSNKIGQPVYLGLNFGVGYNYRLWKTRRIRFSLELRYMPQVFFEGEYETTSTAKFYAKGKFYENPTIPAFNITFTF